MRSLLLLGSAFLATAHDTVFTFTDVSADVALQLVNAKCTECGTGDGLVDMWYPDGFTAESIYPSRNYTLDIRGGPQLKALSDSLGLEAVVKIASVKELMYAEKSNSTAANWNDEYHTFEEIDARMRSLATQYAVQYVASIGTTYNGAAIPAMRFGTSSHKDIIYLQCGIHAREWISPATCMFYIERMLIALRNNVQPMAGYLQDVEVFIVPVLNVDGYKYTWSNQRMWRKNRRANSDGTYGVDLNRNWDDHWGLCGSSSTPSSDTYRGTKAFSEPETEAVQKLFQQLKASGHRIQSGIDFHSYGELILRPYGWNLPNKPCAGTTQPNECVPPNEHIMAAVGTGIQNAIKSVHGKVYTSEHAAELYCAAGGADDWIAVQTTQASGFCLELRDTGSYGFVLPANQIIPTGEEIYSAMEYYFAEVIKSRE